MWVRYKIGEFVKLIIGKIHFFNLEKSYFVMGASPNLVGLFLSWPWDSYKRHSPVRGGSLAKDVFLSLRDLYLELHSRVF